MLRFKAGDNKNNTLEELCLKTARLVLICRYVGFTMSSFSVLKSFYQIGVCVCVCCLYMLFKI